MRLSESKIEKIEDWARRARWITDQFSMAAEWARTHDLNESYEEEPTTLLIQRGANALGNLGVELMHAFILHAEEGGEG